MIIFKHLKVEHFRAIREVDMHFPQRGAILLHGPNEAGKSTLFESIYFALYGAPLSAGTSLDDLIRYGEARASVTLTLSIGATELEIERVIEREQGQRVTLHVRRLGMPEEKPATDLAAANKRIVAELGRLDGETLRESCLIEQKGLNRLEQLNGQEREHVVQNLLGLDKLTRLAEQFKLTEGDEQALQEASERLKLAEIQARIPELSSKLGELEVALDAVGVSEDLDYISLQEADIAEQELSLEQVEARRRELKNRQQRIAQLRKARNVLEEIISAYDAIADAQRELPELERQLAALDRREREELPSLEQRVRELTDLTRSFGTLERMASDLLAAVDTIKELEQELKQQEHLKETLADLDQQLEHTQSLLEEARVAQHELEEQRRTTRPQLEARRQRLQALAGKLRALRQAEDDLAGKAVQREAAQQNIASIEKVRKELQETELKLAAVEKEAQRTQQQADGLEIRWRQLSVRRQLEEWLRLKNLTRGIVEAEQQLQFARQQQERLRLAADEAKKTAFVQLVTIAAAAVVVVLAGGGALVAAINQSMFFAVIAGFIALGVGIFGWMRYQNYNQTRERAQQAERDANEAVSNVSAMVAARENARRMAEQHQDDLTRVENEIRGLGGTVPRSMEEGQYLLQQLNSQDGSIGEVHQQMSEARDRANAIRNQVNAAKESIHDFEQAIDQLQHEISAAAGQEGLPIPVFVPGKRAPQAELQDHVEELIKTTEREIAELDGKVSVLPDLNAKVQVHQEALDVLLARKKSIEERQRQFQQNNPLQKIERAREQQIALRDALRSLQDSLRQRVQPLGVSFGQTAISAAEMAARKQLDALHIALDRKPQLQERQSSLSALLQERQEALSDYYRQLAKFSSSLGSWIVPLNPFADALYALRDRCDREIEEANESGIQRELEQLAIQEGASRAKIELCRHEIEETQERIAAMLAQRGRPPARRFTFPEIAAVWPLIGNYSAQDRSRLEEEIVAVEQELRELEQQDLALSEQLGVGGTTLDVEQARKRMEQQDRRYQTRKRAGLLIQTALERLQRKMIPRTEYYMQHLLSLLTHGRYRDVQLSTQPEEGTLSGGALQVKLWEPAAGSYIPLSALSGGLADQVSLSLRLAFAIAALPRELNAAPGFLLLDEPLSLASGERLRNLVELVNSETLAQHFEQVLFVSQSVDASAFPYHLYIEGGVVVESNLPVEPLALPMTPLPEPMDKENAVESTPVALETI